MQEMTKSLVLMMLSEIMTKTKVKRSCIKTQVYKESGWEIWAGGLLIVVFELGKQEGGRRRRDQARNLEAYIGARQRSAVPDGLLRRPSRHLDHGPYRARLGMTDDKALGVHRARRGVCIAV
jgi:hypothetical protein